MALIIKIDNTTIKNPSKPIEIGRYVLTKAGRVTSGEMMLDYIADKRTFQFEYESLRVDNLNTILNIIEGYPTMFHTLTINENGVVANYTVYPGAVHRTPYRTDNNGYWYYRDVKFQLIEK